MQCSKCKQEIPENELFCSQCGAKTPIFKLANLLRAVGIVDVILTGIVLITGFAAIGKTIELTGIPYTIWSFITNIFSLYIATLVIKNAKNYEKARHLKKMGFAYLVLAIVDKIIAIPISQKFMEEVMAAAGEFDSIVKGLFGFGTFINIIFTCSIPVLYIIFSSKIEKMYLKSKEGL